MVGKGPLVAVGETGVIVTTGTAVAGTAVALGVGACPPPAHQLERVSREPAMALLLCHPWFLGLARVSLLVVGRIWSKLPEQTAPPG